MKNYIQPGNTLALTAPSDVSGGDPILVGSIFGVVATDAKSGSQMQIAVEGVFNLPKADVAVTEGAKLYWAAGSGHLTTTSSGNALVAKAAEAAGDSAVMIKARLNG